jgi:cysteine-rich repeat protein
MRALARDRQGRHATAEALQIDLETFARDARLSISPVELGRTVDELCPPEPAPEELEAAVDADAARLPEASPVSRSRARDLGRALVRWRLALVLAVPLIAAGGLAWRAFAPGLRCGDGVVDAGEQCDDGNDRDSDGCLRSCRFPRCGDGLVRAGVEECDPAAPGAAASCSSNCLRCGGDGASFAHPETGHCYTLVATPAPWSRARTNCGLAGGYLATYATSRETREVFDALVVRSRAPLWMSRFRAIERESGGVWDNDERLPAASLFRIWDGPPAEPEGCFLQIPRMGVDQQNPAVVWRATPCSEPAPYLCEREGWIIRPRDNHAYRLFRLGHTWKAAEEACRKIGAHLVTVGDADEESFVEANFAGTRWLGGSDLQEEGKFRWVTGEPFTFGDWAPREPDQSTGDDDCLALDVDGVWHDRRCGMGNAFVCEAE